MRDASNAKDGTVRVGRREYRVEVAKDSKGRPMILLHGKRGAVYGLMLNEKMTHDGSRVFFAVNARGFGLAMPLEGIWFHVDADGSVLVIGGTR